MHKMKNIFLLLLEINLPTGPFNKLQLVFTKT